MEMEMIASCLTAGQMGGGTEVRRLESQIRKHSGELSQSVTLLK